MQFQDNGRITLDMGNSSFFEDLVFKYQKSLQRVAFNVIYSEEDAKDIVQESFLTFYLISNF